MTLALAASPENEEINQISLDGQTPLFSTDERGLPVFLGETFEEHVDTFQGIDQSIHARKWALASIASSLVTRYKEKTVAKFASEVRHSASYIYELASTYKKFKNYERSEILSFRHHMIAARHKNPQKAIAHAEDQEMSTRELEKWVSKQEPPTRKAVKEIETLHLPAVRLHLEETIQQLKNRDDDVPASAPFLHNMYHAMIGQVQWQLDRTVDEDCDRIFDAIEDGCYRFDDMFKWLQERGYFMREPEVEDRLATMVERKRVRETKEGGRKDTQRGEMTTIWVPYYARGGDDFTASRNTSIYDMGDPD